MSTVRENLIAARALIDTPEKWGKGRGFVPPAHGMCVLGACSAAGFNGVGALTPHIPTFGVSVVSFNDHPATTHSDILALFDRAISSQPESSTP